jgi:hypothetical protein
MMVFVFAIKLLRDPHRVVSTQAENVQLPVVPLFVGM